MKISIILHDAGKIIQYFAAKGQERLSRSFT